jgi:hypothetical protein
MSIRRSPPLPTGYKTVAPASAFGCMLASVTSRPAGSARLLTNYGWACQADRDLPGGISPLKSPTWTLDVWATTTETAARGTGLEAPANAYTGQGHAQSHEGKAQDSYRWYSTYKEADHTNGEGEPGVFGRGGKQGHTFGAKVLMHTRVRSPLVLRPRPLSSRTLKGEQGRSAQSFHELLLTYELALPRTYEPRPRIMPLIPAFVLKTCSSAPALIP